ncbi:hypothetical protein D7030_13215 [Flavobacteriaceae bacterium AU392]|nr:hypothetical protein D1817_05275 [Flavobacteriaceae bacterium]RKM81262.1 hypothetical protein D7030_13215 [Flavobacteriaceae bacterium AU392]
MITPLEKKKLKNFLKSNYAQDVLKVLKKRNVTNRKGNPYSESMIRNVLSGQENQDIEDAIFEVYSNRKEQYQKKQEEKKRTLYQ